MEKINQETIEHSALGETVPDELLKYPSPNNPPWNTPVAIGLWFFSVVLVLFVPVLFAMPYILSLGIDLSNPKVLTDISTSDPTAVLLQIGAIIPAHILTLIAAYFVVTKFRKYSFKEMLGWEWGGYKWWHTIVLILAVFAVAALTNAIFGSRDNDLMKILRSSRYVVFLVAFMATFSAPIVEEVVYRGVLYSAFQRSTNIPMAVILVTAVFALVHYPQYWGDPATIITLTFLSLLLTLVRVWTNSLLPCIFFHFIFNGIQSVLLILEPYLPKALNPTGIEPTAVEGFFHLLK